MTRQPSDALNHDAAISARAQGPWVFRKAGSGEFVAEYSLHRWVHAPDAVVPELRWSDQVARARQWTDLAEVNAVRTLLLKAGVEIELVPVSPQSAG